MAPSFINSIDYITNDIILIKHQIINCHYYVIQFDPFSNMRSLLKYAVLNISVSRKRECKVLLNVLLDTPYKKLWKGKFPLNVHKYFVSGIIIKCRWGNLNCQIIGVITFGLFYRQMSSWATRDYTIVILSTDKIAAWSNSFFLPSTMGHRYPDYVWVPVQGKW